MTLIYSIAMAAVAFVLIAAVIDTILTMHEKPVWSQKSAPLPALSLVETTERRQDELPFVGVDRRQSSIETAPNVQQGSSDLRRAA